MHKWCYPVLNGSPTKRHIYTVQPGTGFMDDAYYRARGMVHCGADWNATTGGQSDLKDPVYSSSDGIVIAAGYYPVWGNIVLIHHPSAGVWTQYAHLYDFSVHEGQMVRMGQQIGRIGQGGRSRLGVPLFVAHLHYEVRYVYVSPQDWPSSDSPNDSRAQEEALCLASRVDPIHFLMKNNALKTYRAVQAA